MGAKLIYFQFHQKAPVCISSPAPSRASSMCGATGDEDESAVHITNGKQAEVAAKRIFLNVAKPGSKARSAVIFTCEVDIILKALVEDEELMNMLFSFLEPEHPHSALLAGYFSKWLEDTNVLEMIVDKFSSTVSLNYLSMNRYSQQPYYVIYRLTIDLFLYPLLILIQRIPKVSCEEN
ncbi:putative SIT4 phosphatase-associated protein family [Helianthus annuus]|nr:putative SIT4 phosphatase-associated protein family [Helianthus annuus]KAJ0533535.1 putative SIT4 phosphatase-associated protein family [Helianthus annuus]KAJ0541808.1 putative SIT4 phosphatase-associated protein family [Helianthus annuus]KAJ0706885.1 putative SIT4 phosphatase-associated protein family [Helianthus annuus]KAJ0710903.1 putative SIT4 phosphatase-associated protein family [Helianthus annuus]